MDLHITVKQFERDRLRFLSSFIEIYLQLLLGIWVEGMWI